MQVTEITHIKRENTLICKDSNFNLLSTPTPVLLTRWQTNSGKQNVNKINYVVAFYLVKKMLNFTIVFYNFEISLSSVSTTIYLFI